MDATQGTPGMEALVRQLLQLLGRVTGLESVYLTRIEWSSGHQAVVWSNNTGTIEIPEGLAAPLADTVCSRALAGRPAYTTDVPRDYGDVEMALSLGLQTYLMVPVVSPEGDVFGTVCGISGRAVEVSEDARNVMATLSEMITLHLAAEGARQRLAEANARLEQLAFLDPLTGVGNRRAIEHDLVRVCGDAARRNEPIGILSIDVDRFKAINDTHGHAAGDAVLRMIADRLQGQTRTGDIVARLGGDEFVVVLPGATAATVAMVAERVRTSISMAVVPVDGGALVTATVSVGAVSCCDPAGPEAVLAGADEALYVAKARGRNCVAGSRAELVPA